MTPELNEALHGLAARVEMNAATIPLEREHVQRAASLAQSIGCPARQWATYGHTLAWLVFEDWLQKRAPELAVQLAEHSALRSRYAAVLEAAACNLTVGEFRVCLLPTLALDEETLALPRAALDLAWWRAHFYVAIGLSEAAETASILGFLRYDQLQRLQSDLVLAADWHYCLPVNCLKCDADALLLLLQCLDPAAIALPAVVPIAESNPMELQQALTPLQDALQARPLWQVLSWEQGQAVLAQPQLLEESISVQSEAIEGSPDRVLAATIASQAVNVADWFRSQLAAVETLSWQMLPTTAPVRQWSSRLRIEALETMLADIAERHSLEVPPNACRACRDFLGAISLRLYAVSWPQSWPQREEGTWNLLLLLGALPDQLPPPGLQLQISDQTSVLLVEQLRGDSLQQYLFVQLEGEAGDRFEARALEADGTLLFSEAFEYRQDEADPNPNRREQEP